MGARFTPATDPLHGGMPLGFVPVSDENVDLLKRINAVIFPLIYRDRFYADIMSKQSMSYLIYLGHNLIGSFCSHFTRSGDREEWELYVATFGLLAPYRRAGIGHHALQHLLGLTRAARSFSRVYLHVQESNTAAMAFYQREGFICDRLIEGYYKKIQPPNAYLLSKLLG